MCLLGFCREGEGQGEGGALANLALDVDGAVEEFNEEFVEHLDNGNPACPACVADEQKREEQQ